MEQNSKDKVFYNLLYIITIYLFVVGLLFNSPREILEGLRKIMLHRSLLITDYMGLTSIGAAFFNAGLVSVIGILILRLSHTNINGLVIAAQLTLIAFYFFGKNPYNILAPVIGVFFHSIYRREKFKNYTIFALFATAAGPVVSYSTFGYGFSILGGAVLGNILGIIIGFLLPFVALATAAFHKGHSLYNNGIALGLISTMVYSGLKAFGYETIVDPIMMEGVNRKLLIVLLILFVGFLIPKVKKGKSVEDYKVLLNTSIKANDYTDNFTYETVLFNMGIVGLMGIIYVLLVGGDLNGPTVCGIFGVVAFGAFGKNFKNVLAIMIGVGLCASITQYDIGSTPIVIAALFGTTLAPMASRYGFIGGIIAGICHLFLVTNTAILHGSLFLYNNGLAGGLVAGILTPIYDGLGKTSCNSKSIN